MKSRPRRPRSRADDPNHNRQQPPPPRIQSHHTQRRSLPPRHARAARPGTHRRPQDHPDRPRNQQPRPRRHHPRPHLHGTSDPRKPRGRRSPDRYSATSPPAQRVGSQPSPCRPVWFAPRSCARSNPAGRAGARERRSCPSLATSQEKSSHAFSRDMPCPTTPSTPATSTSATPANSPRHSASHAPLPRRPAAQVVRRLQGTLPAARPSSTQR